MIDGVKFICFGINAKDWEDNGLLVFKTGIDTKTGEIFKNGKKIAFFKGLSFHITPGKIPGTFHFTVRGSLAKYYTHGKTNAFDFTASMLLTVIQELKDKFKIDPSNTIIQNLEYGINIFPPMETKKFLKGLIAYRSNGFKTFSSENTKLGQCIGMPNYKTIKFYDKSEQDKNAPLGLIRIEIGIKRMSIIAKYGIKTLADLTASKVGPLLGELLELWNECIFIGEKCNYREMTVRERSKWLYYINPKKWEDQEKKQRHRMKKHFLELNAKYGTDDKKQETLLLISQKIKELTAEKPLKNVHLFGDFFDGYESQKLKLKKGPFTSLDKDVIRAQKPNRNLKEKGHRKNLKKCKVCKKEISNLKAGSKFCSKTCNNSFHGKIRTEKRRFNILTEKEILENLLKNIQFESHWLLISYQADGINYSDILHQKEISFKGTIGKNVFKLVLSSTMNFENKIILTSYRARKYIQTVKNYNTKKNF